MKCTNCGFENQQDVCVCSQCQTPLQQDPVAQPILRALKDSLFLIICILMSASCLFSLANGNVPLINILLTVFLWLTYSQSKKNVVDTKHLRCVSGAVFANYVITFVLAGVVLLLGLIFTLFYGVIVSDPALMSAITMEIAGIDSAEVTALLSVLPGAGVVIFIVFLLIAAAVALFNIFSMRYIHRFAKSVYQSVENGVLDLQYVNAAQIWLFIFGGFGAISALSAEGVTSFLIAAAEAAACILAGLLIRKYFTAAPVPVQQISSEE